MTGRGAWNTAGDGGTKKYRDATRPGPYYYLNTGKKPLLRRRNANEYAVYRAVRAYQEALNRRLGETLLVDGWLGKQTSSAITKFQTTHSSQTGTPWGGIGPDTSRTLLLPDVRSELEKRDNTKVTLNMVTGTIHHESNWDAGAVGYSDNSDLGLAQINGNAHPDLTKVQRLDPIFAANFVINYYETALRTFNGNVRDAVASFNLGAGGARSWIASGRPDVWTPSRSSTPRNVNDYIDSILKG